MMANWYHFQFLKTLLLRTRFAQEATLQTLLTQLTARIASLNRPKDPKAVTITIHSLAVDEFHVRDWSSLPLQQWASLIPRQLKEVKKRLSFKSRQFQYFQLSKFRKRHEQRRANREYKKLFKSLLNHFQQPIEEVATGPETIEARPDAIHKLLTTQFKAHHEQNPRTKEHHN
jgi:hypothetical protein